MSTKRKNEDVVEPAAQLDELDVAELLLEPSPWDELWPVGAVVEYLGPIDELELVHRTEDGVYLRRTVARGSTIEVSPELALELEERGDFKRKG